MAIYQVDLGSYGENIWHPDKVLAVGCVPADAILGTLAVSESDVWDPNLGRRIGEAGLQDGYQVKSFPHCLLERLSKSNGIQSN